MLIEAIKLTQNLQNSAASPGPIIVNCSAGVGRTGVFITIAMIYQQIEALFNSKDPEKIKEEASEMSIYSKVDNLRNQRPYMVQTEAQYKFIDSIFPVCVSINVIITSIMWKLPVRGHEWHMWNEQSGTPWVSVLFYCENIRQDERWVVLLQDRHHSLTLSAQYTLNYS